MYFKHFNQLNYILAEYMYSQKTSKSTNINHISLSASNACSLMNLPHVEVLT